MSENDKLREALETTAEALRGVEYDQIRGLMMDAARALAASKPEASAVTTNHERAELIEHLKHGGVYCEDTGMVEIDRTSLMQAADLLATSKPEPQAQAGEPVAVSNAFGCDKEAAGGTLCADWCGGPQCPTSNTSPEVDSSTEAYKAYADNLPGAHDHLTDGARKRLEEAANFCLSPRPNFEPKRNRGSDDGYYEHAEASRLWWAFAAGMNYEEKRTREAITKKDAALNACVEALGKINRNGALLADHEDMVYAAITQAQEQLK